MDRHGRMTPAAPRSAVLRTATRIVLILVVILVAPLAAPGRADDAEPVDARGLRFTRVHVPRGKLAGIPLGPTRYVPMSAQEFEEAVARVSAAPRGLDAAAPGLEAVATSARYTLAVTATGTLSGSVAFDIAAQAAGQRGGVSREMPLGELAVRRGSVRTAAGTGEAVVFGRPGGGVAVATPEPGEYTCLFECGSSGQTAEGPAFVLPLVPALFSSVVMRVPAGLRPVLSGDALATGAVVAAGAAPPADGAAEWRIDVGPLETLDFILAAAAREPPLVSAWTQIDIRGSQASLAVTVVPQSPWDAGEFILRKSPSIVLTQVRMADGGRDAAAPQEFAEVAWTVSDDGRTIAIFLPPSFAGHRNPILLRGVAPIGRTNGMAPEELPAIRPPASRWAGGGVILQADPSLSLAGIELQDCLAVTPEVAARWPLLAAHDDPAREATVIDADADAGGSSRLSPPRVALEHQGPDAAAKVIVNPRVAELDIARVTTVDVSPGVVLGRTACDIRVNRGVAFDLAARVAAGWFIDSVEAVAAAGPSERAEAADPDAPLEWKVVRDPRGDLLKIGLTMAATPERSLGLRITGHRAGVATGISFSSAEMDMVRIDGETDGLAVIEFRTNAGSAVEAGTTVEMEDDDAKDDGDPRLAALAEEGTLCGRVSAGPGDPARRLRLVRRRPPLDAQTQVRLSVRDDKLAESFTFECIPDRSELDAIVVHFTEPLDDRLEWSLLPPATGTITARRTEQPDRRRAEGKRGIEAAESWIIELSPPAREAVTIRAVRTVPFTGPVPFPLAWIEGATNQVGEVIVRDAGRRRPRVVNRRLRELPPGPADADQSLSTVVELSFDAARDRSDDGLPAAELVPGDGNEAFEARAWAWRAITSCWCHASGTTEYETLFEIENHGRATVALELMPGKRLQGLLIDGVAMPLTGQTGDHGLIAIDLPAGKRFVRLLVRSLAEQDPRRGLWRIDSLGGTIDVPVLEHEWRVLLPPELDIAVAAPSHRAVAAEAGDWMTRLLAAAFRPAWWPAAATEEPAPASMGGGSLRQGFRERLFVPAGGPPGGGEITIVSAGLLSAAAVLAAFAAAGLSLVLSPRGRPWAAVAACLVAGVAALWVPVPFDVIARAAWWGTLAAVWLRSRPGTDRERSGRRAAALLAVIALAGGPSSEARAQPGPSGDQPGQPVALGGGPMRVFMTPVDRGETALVPEELFRVLARSEAAASVVAVRVIESRVLVGRSDGDHWQLLLDVDADAGATLAMDQTPSGARWVAGTARIDGVAAPARIERGGRLLQLTVNAAGRRRIELEIEPSVSQRGEVVVTTAGIPVAPSAVLERAESPSAGPFSRPDGADREQCEAAPSGGVFVAARRSADRGQTVVFDVARAAQVRLVRPLDPRTRLAGVVRKAASRNDIAWELDACRLLGTYTIDPGDEIVRSVVVRADPRLELAPSERPRNASPFASTTPTDGVDDAVEIRPIGGHRYAIDRLWPTRGPVTLAIPLRMPLADPAGVFAVPEAWLEDVAVDDRTTRLTPAGDLALTVDLADGAIPIPPRDSDPVPHPQAWWVEVSQSASGERATESPAATRPPRSGTERPARVTVERRRQDVRGSQNLAVTFAADQIRLQLQARLDASSTALFAIPLVVPAACEIDRVRLFEDDALASDSVERDAIDLRWSRRERGRIIAVVQRPRSGRFRLEVDARLPGKPPATGPLPLLHAELTAGAPVLVTWRGDDGTAVTVRQPDAPPADRMVEHAVGRPAPRYAIAAAAAGPAGDSAQEPAQATTLPPVADATIRPRVELADIHLMADERGRAWGMVRFDLVAATPELHIALPPGMRLFDLLIDGHAAGTAVPSLPHGKNAWSVRLLDVRWPRSVLAVFAGELATRLVDGGPLVLPAPAVIGLPCDQTLWTLHVPDGVSLRVAEPARVVDEAGLSRERHAAVLRLEGDFERAMAACDGLERTRLEELVRLRKEGTMLPLEAAWERVMAAHRPADAIPVSRIAIVVGAGGQDVTVHGVRRRDPTVATRAVATLSLLAIGGMAWTAARRRPADWARHIDRGAPFLAMLLGCVWLLALAPMWPGWLLLAGGCWAAVSRRTGSSPDDLRPAADDDSSTTQIAPAPAPAATASARGPIDPGN
jgi:hypothetical protein